MNMRGKRQKQWVTLPREFLYDEARALRYADGLGHEIFEMFKRNKYSLMDLTSITVSEIAMAVVSHATLPSSNKKRKKAKRKR